MGFHQPAVGINGDLEQPGKANIIMGHNGGRQTKNIRIYSQPAAKDGIVKGHGHPLTVGCNLRLFIGIVSEKKNPPASCFPVKVLSFAVCPDIPVKDINVCLRVAIFQFQSAFNGMGAAHFRTVGMFLVSGTDALDKNHITGPFYSEVIISEQFIHFQVSDNGCMFAVQVFFRLILFGTGG